MIAESLDRKMLPCWRENWARVLPVESLHIEEPMYHPEMQRNRGKTDPIRTLPGFVRSSYRKGPLIGFRVFRVYIYFTKLISTRLAEGCSPSVLLPVTPCHASPFLGARTGRIPHGFARNKRGLASRGGCAGSRAPSKHALAPQTHELGSARRRQVAGQHKNKAPRPSSWRPEPPPGGLLSGC